MKSMSETFLAVDAGAAVEQEFGGGLRFRKEDSDGGGGTAESNSSDISSGSAEARVASSTIDLSREARLTYEAAHAAAAGIDR